MLVIRLIEQKLVQPLKIGKAEFGTGVGVFKRGPPYDAVGSVSLPKPQQVRFVVLVVGHKSLLTGIDVLIPC